MSTLRIDIESTQCSPCSYLFNQKRILIGRSPRSQVCIPDLRVSLEHLQIIWTEDGKLEILDTYSKSGVWGGTTHLKPGQAYTAHHQVMVRFLEYRISISIFPLLFVELLEED
jgi:predicted component of type VI protein secretion system